jgi:hypothetical protein
MSQGVKQSVLLLFCSESGQTHQMQHYRKLRILCASPQYCHPGRLQEGLLEAFPAALKLSAKVLKSIKGSRMYEPGIRIRQAIPKFVYPVAAFL